MTETFDAAWFPYSITDQVAETAAAVDLVSEPSRRPKVLAIRGMQAVDSTPALAVFARGATVVTPRSRGRVQGASDVLVFAPDWDVMDLAQSRAHGGTLTVVEEFTTSVRGWAQAVGALNLGTGEPTPDPAPREVRDVISQIHFSGNNGYGRKTIAYDLTRRRLRELADGGWSDGDRIVGGVFALGKSSSALQGLQALVDEVFPSPTRDGTDTFYTHARDAARCPIDDFPMVDVTASLWVCRSCGHQESKH